jgi:hypothetical protein
LKDTTILNNLFSLLLRLLSAIYETLCVERERERERERRISTFNVISFQLFPLNLENGDFSFKK